ncbi:hypothetical protein BTO15_08985 [Polaribacter sejongensis]|uniref:Acyltransferase n=1 Tax=Polaribacter sejongensis TaxID=985043 RepID=A0ABN5F432_9FLAO|nr:acyltransferase family protein [Polaribacter sejongensis]AUC22218.1 hypothetical protein BTO15_08985 [Polaribacter sejongensis]
MSFRYDIGFLRALAVVVVVFFHYQIPFFEGGFVGVDIFFVISGYLMTRIILKKFQTNSFILSEFYKRRLTRILPVLIVMIIGVLISTYFLYFPIDFRQLSLYSLFSSLFLSNYYYLFNSGYFDPSAQSNILLHTWSLSVEWQFYMIYPLFLILIRKIYLKKYKKFKVIFLTVTILSFFLIIIFNNFLPTNYTKISFFSFTHRAWEMMLGGVAFLYSDFFQTNISIVLKKLITYLCFLGLAISIFCFTDNDVWPSALTLLPTISSFLLIAIHKEYSFYKNRGIQYVGSISYSLYLWHWPIYVISKYFDYNGWDVIISLLILSVILSVLTYTFIEKKTKFISVNAILVTTFFTLLISGLAYFFPLNNHLFSEDVVALSEYRQHYEATRAKQFHSGTCHHMKKINYKDCLCINFDKKNVLLLGDSHAAQYSLSLRSKLDSSKYNFIEHTVVGTLPLINFQGEKMASKQFQDIFENFIVTNKDKIDVIILSGHWVNYHTFKDYENDVDLAKGINETIFFVEKLGIKLIILGQTEKYNINFSRVEAFKMIGKKEKSYIDENSFLLNNNLKKLVPVKNYIDLFLRSEFKHYDNKTKTPYMFDDDHLSLYGADQVIDFLIKEKKI